MWLSNGIFAGLIAGIIMGVVSQAAYRLGILKSHLIIIDGKFALRKLSMNPTPFKTYITGILIHLFTSMVFGMVYVLFARFAALKPGTIWVITLYFLLLWLAMLVVALPLAEQGFWGKRIGNFVWLEQLVLHIVFAVSFWGLLGIF